METNPSVSSKQHRNTYQRYYRAFAKRVRPALQQLLLQQRVIGLGTRGGDGGVGAASRLSGHRGEDTSDVLQVSEVYFQRLCEVAQCNSLGV
ncbi:hypothetical protein LPMP_230940 [Leishmania panamensis]|uniref:Uncharacterized protein n=1 Tax=Leishmania panamensis TaxID=5679 RepID=A0A088RTG2_LEIPA|nr:hypothetical protein LPMP_230940 [Leishmania panamensis]AIN98544.1 hypothetical protein LPMP_230940 [Leishmania panamensis]CAJ2473748.1 unnamed protein product [Leishmania braziliensis]